MRLSLRFVISLFLALGALACRVGLIASAIRLSVRWDQAL